MRVILNDIDIDYVKHPTLWWLRSHSRVACLYFNSGPGFIDTKEVEYATGKDGQKAGKGRRCE